MTFRVGLIVVVAMAVLLPHRGFAIVNGDLETGFATVGALENDTGSWASGVLIDPYWVLTTASFVQNSSSGIFHTGFDRAAPDESHPVSAMFPHPFYDPDTGAYNIALLRLTTPVSGATPIPYLTSPVLYEGAPIRYVGYGWATESDPGNTNRRSCLDTVFTTYSTTFLTYNSTTGPYFGDTGGPALLQMSGEWYVAGIIGAFAAAPLQYTQSIRVSPFAPFLADVITNNPPPVTAVGEPPDAVLRLRAAPNPFNPATTISFELSELARVRLCVYDAAGRHVATLRDGELGPGSHELRWRGVDDHGRSLASGSYSLRLQAGSSSAIHRVTLLK